MTLTDTVSSLAHDAATVASDLGSQAVELGRTAADAGLEAATLVATAAAHLAQNLAHKVPAVPTRRRSRTPWIIAGLVAVIAAVAFVRRRRAAGATLHDAARESAKPATVPTSAAPAHANGAVAAATS